MIMFINKGLNLPQIQFTLDMVQFVLMDFIFHYFRFRHASCLFMACSFHCWHWPLQMLQWFMQKSSIPLTSRNNINELLFPCLKAIIYLTWRMEWSQNIWLNDQQSYVLYFFVAIVMLHWMFLSLNKLKNIHNEVK